MWRDWLDVGENLAIAAGVLLAGLLILGVAYYALDTFSSQVCREPHPPTHRLHFANGPTEGLLVWRAPLLTWCSAEGGVVHAPGGSSVAVPISHSVLLEAPDGGLR